MRVAVVLHVVARRDGLLLYGVRQRNPDLVPTAAHVQPTWVAAFDLTPLQVIENKNRWLTEAVKGQWWCAFAHETKLAFARIRSDAKTQFAVE